MRQLLSGITVLELAEGIAGSYCAKVFADLGADVVKVETPSGDPLRHHGGAPRGPDGLFRGGAFLHLNTNKRSIVIDPASEPDRARLARLIDRSHVVIEAAGAIDAASTSCLDGWGMSWREIHERSPATSVVHISGFGANGPYADYRWDDLVVQAISGAMVLHGRSELGPLRLPAHVALCFVGNMAALGGLAAVVTAQSNGNGAFVDCAAVEALATLPPRLTTLLAHQYRDRQPGPDTWRLTATSETLIPSGVFPCRDGYLALLSTPQQLAPMLDVLDDDNLRAAFARPDAFERGETKEAIDAALYPWLLDRTRAEATTEAQRAGWPMAGVNSPAELLTADHLHQRGFWVHADDPGAGPIDLPGAPCLFAEGGWALRRLAPSLGEHTAEIAAEIAAEIEVPVADARAPAAATVASATTSPRLPLEGIRVVDLTVVWSGPYATMLLADLGAEVIRVENPWVLPPSTKGYTARPTSSNLGYLGSLYGPPAPGRPDRPWNRHAMNNSLARNKRSCTIDVRRAEGMELLMQLAERSDVFIDNFKADGLARIGISVSELHARNPRLIIVRMPPTGTTGDWSGYTGFGVQFDGLTGLLWLLGHRGEDLMATPGTTFMDGASGPAAAFATLAALRYRDATGRGQVVELSQSENLLNYLGDVFVDCELGVAPERFANRDRWRAPQGLYRCDGENRWLAITVANDHEWRALAAVMGRAELGDDPRFADAASRHAHHDELDDLIGAWAAHQPMLDAFHALQSAGVAAGPLLDDELFGDDPQIRAREWLRPLPSTDVGTHLHPGLPFRGVPAAWDRGSPTLGEDNEYVYQQLLGVSDAEFRRYRDDKILAEDYLDAQGEPY